MAKEVLRRVVKKQEVPEDDTDEQKIINELSDMDDIEDLPKGKPKGKTLSAIMVAINTKFGSKTIVSLRDKPDFPRIPTGVHNVDYILGGGIPISQSSCFFGGFSGGKTTLALNTVAVVQNLCMNCYKPYNYCTCSQAPLIQEVAWLNPEGTLDKVWAATNNVDIDKLMVAEADSAEGYVDVAIAILEADTCGLVCLDSVGALMPLAILDASAEQQSRGIEAKLITKLVKKTKQALITQAKEGHRISFLNINQKRLDLKVKFGNPETTTGGEAFKHEQSIMLRCGKLTLQEGDKSYKGSKEGDRDVATKHTVSVNKAKVYTLGASTTYVRSLDFIHPEWGNTAGKIMDYKFLVGRAREIGVLGDDPKNLIFMDTKYKTQKELILHLVNNYQAKLMLSILVVEEAKRQRVG